MLESNIDYLVITSPDDLFGDQSGRKHVRKDTAEILPLSLISCVHKNEYRIEGSGADENLDVEIYLVGSDQTMINTISSVATRGKMSCWAMKLCL